MVDAADVDAAAIGVVTIFFYVNQRIKSWRISYSVFNLSCLRWIDPRWFYLAGNLHTLSVISIDCMCNCSLIHKQKLVDLYPPDGASQG